MRARITRRPLTMANARHSSMVDAVGEQLELDLLANHGAAVEADSTAVREAGIGGGFSTTNYWSSTENATTNAWYLNFNSGSWNDNNNKNNTNAVRCVRSYPSVPTLDEPASIHPKLAHRLSAEPITLEEVFDAYFDCRRNKRNTPEQLRFEMHLEQNLVRLYESIKDQSYQPLPSIVFAVLHPKPREVWAAQFRDRIVHHLIYNRLSPYWHRVLLPNTCACVPGRGTHYGVDMAQKQAASVTRNYTRPGWFLKADIANFFGSIDQAILWRILEPSLRTQEMRFLVRAVLFQEMRTNCVVRDKHGALARVPRHKSLFHSPPGVGLPIGNLTSQFFANIYLHALDEAAHGMVGHRFVRYVDDWIFFGEDLDVLRDTLRRLDDLLRSSRRQLFHPEKTRFARLDQGFDFIGYYVLPGRRYVRHRTLRSILARLRQPHLGAQSRASLLGILKHGAHYRHTQMVIG